MLFNSIDFAIFLPIVFAIYWYINKRSIKLQNVFLLIASYYFYGSWDPRFLLLIALSTVVDYAIGLSLDKASLQPKRKLLLALSVFVNIGILATFKYFNFFIENFTEAFSFFGVSFEMSRLNIVLPVGISFYTFQTMSYTIDVYRRNLKATRDFISFAAFVSFFPQLVAGPIERATNLLPQFFTKREFSYNKSVDGLRQILWGLFKKVVIADNCAQFANQIFSEYASLNSSSLILGALFFTMQIYCDFSGYSDIAIGTSRLFGFNLMKNFAFPYFSRDIAEFWRRWHISLSTWFRDYVYIPLGGSKGSKVQQVRNIFIIFLVSGFWHGANWTFIAWGALNAIFFLPLLLLGSNRKHLGNVAENKLIPSFREFISMLLTFWVTVFAWVFFRAENLNHAFSYIGKVGADFSFSVPDIDGMTRAVMICVLVLFMVGVEWLGRDQEHALAKLGLKYHKVFRYIFYYCLIVAIIWFGGEEQEFIYFQF